jgi:hypothetical protein
VSRLGAPGVYCGMPGRRSNSDERARERDFLHRVARRLGGGHVPPFLAPFVDNILAPVRSAARIARLIDALTIGKPRAEAEQLADEAEARIRELQPRPPGPEPRWQARFLRWQREIEAGKLLADILREEEVPEGERRSIRSQFDRWRRAMK